MPGPDAVEPPTHTQVTARNEAPAAASPRSAEQEFRAQVDRDLPRNFTAHLIHGLLGQNFFKTIDRSVVLSRHQRSLAKYHLSKYISAVFFNDLPHF